MKVAKKVYGPYRNGEGRAFVITVFEDGSRETTSYPKWLMEQQLGRKLDRDLETVHHKDEDFRNDSLDNFELKTRSQHAKDHARPKEMATFACPQCGCDFEKEARVVRHNQKKQGKAGPFCSKSCAGKWTRTNQIDAGMSNLRSGGVGQLASRESQKLRRT